MADLQTNVRYIKGIGETRAKALEKLNIFTLRDLISYFPRAYEDRTKLYPINALPLGESVCCQAMVAAAPTSRRINGGRTLVKFRAVDDTGTLDLTFFNQTYLTDSVHAGDIYTFYGKAEGTSRHPQMTNPVMEVQGRQSVTGRIVPLYPLTAGLSQYTLSKAIRQGLDECSELLGDVLPDEVRQTHQLCHSRYAYENIHFPADEEALALARRRLVFEELFLLGCGLSLLRRRRTDVPGPACRAVSLSPFSAALPFSLTEAQQKAIGDILGDMLSGQPMNRLVQGDVGSGKTMVAAAAMWFAAQNGWQSALMAPTEILARQHYETLAPLFEKLGLHCALLTGSTKARDRRELLKNLQDGHTDILIGTHALLTEDVQYARLGLVVTDEQHRFGVNQRSALGKKADHPHVLVLSATPIPRTLALIIYGDLDVSIIDTLPPGRQKVDTFAVGEKYRQRIQAFIRKEVEAGHQAFIVCPLVGDGEEMPDERKAVTAYAQHLQEDIFPDLRVLTLHGKMKPKEKEAVMAAFSTGQADILVSTTVVEVGVDVPNATLMIVENADRFGLSQLHQLRGRVGRGQAKSYCILLSDSDNPETRQRLHALVDSNDGFKISEEDLRLRGPGDFFGQRQHGLPVLKAADLQCDMRLLEEAQAAARKLLETDPRLSREEHRALKDRILELFELNAQALN